MTSYAVITPVRNESENLRRLAHSLAEQTARPAIWMIVDTGSDDDTGDVIAELLAAHDWIATCSSDTVSGPTRARPRSEECCARRGSPAWSGPS